MNLYREVDRRIAEFEYRAQRAIAYGLGGVDYALRAAPDLVLHARAGISANKWEVAGTGATIASYVAANAFNERSLIYVAQLSAILTMGRIGFRTGLMHFPGRH